MSPSLLQSIYLCISCTCFSLIFSPFLPLFILPLDYFFIIIYLNHHFLHYEFNFSNHLIFFSILLTLSLFFVLSIHFFRLFLHSFTPVTIFFTIHLSLQIFSSLFFSPFFFTIPFIIHLSLQTISLSFFNLCHHSLRYSLISANLVVILTPASSLYPVPHPCKPFHYTISPQEACRISSFLHPRHVYFIMFSPLSLSSPLSHPCHHLLTPATIFSSLTPHFLYQSCSY